MFVVTVTFRTDPADFDRFLPLMQANAATSLAEEPGCRQFDVCKGEGAEVFLYEVYTDRPAFDAHLNSGHFKAFDAEVAGLVTFKEVKTYLRL